MVELGTDSALPVGMASTTYTLLHRNEVLGTARFCGTYSTDAEAMKFASIEAARLREFIELQLYTGSPSNPGRYAGRSVRGGATIMRNDGHVDCDCMSCRPATS
jgi:hypothetical protein